MKSLKCYMVFTPIFYRLAMFILYPAAAVAAYYFFLIGFGYSTLLLPIVIAISAEIMGDYFVFGGIAKRNEEKVEYLKCSNRGMKVFQQALIVDNIRRFIWILLINLLCCLLDHTVSLEPVLTFSHIFVVTCGTYALIALTLMLTRFATMLVWNLIAVYAEIMIGCICYVLCAALIQSHVLISILITAIPAVIISILGLKIILKRIGGSYYDGEI